MTEPRWTEPLAEENAGLRHEVATANLALILAERALIDLGACADPDCTEPNCLHAVVQIRDARRGFPPVIEEAGFWGRSAARLTRKLAKCRERNVALYEALERTLDRLQAALGRRVIRDATETIADAERVLAVARGEEG